MTASWTDLARIALKRDEALRLKPYDDKTGETLTKLPSGGNVTIGIGWNLSANGLPPDIIEDLFQRSLEGAKTAITSIFGEELFAALSDNRKVGLVSLPFEFGEWEFRHFANTIAAVKVLDWTKAEAELRDSAWFHEVGDRAERVIAMLCHDQFPYSAG